MIQYYLDLEKQVKAINDVRLAYGQIQKIYSTAFFISFSIRTPGKTWHLYLGRGNGQEGIWISEVAPASVLRRKDNFLEYLRRHLSSCSLVDLELDQYDRILKLSYQKFGQLHSILFFWKARKLYFVHYYQEAPESPFKLLLSWHGKAVNVNEEIDNLYACFNEIGRREDMKHDLHSPQHSSIEQLLEDEKKAAALKGMTSAPSFLQRKIGNIEDDLRKARQWEQLQKILDHEESLEMYELKVGDHKIKFEGDLNPFERRNLLFQKIKKLKRGEGILNQRLEDTKEMLKGKNTEPKSISSLPIVKPVWGKDEKNIVNVASGNLESVKDSFRIFKFDLFSVGVGLNSQGNDQLRNKWASKEDLWLHLDGLKSAHAIIKLHQTQHVDAGMLNMASSILAYFSHFNDEWIPIIFTPVKNLKGVTGSAGMVIYKKEKHLRCARINPEVWLKE